MTSSFVFGIVAPDGSELAPAFAKLSGEVTSKSSLSLSFEARTSTSYEALAKDVKEGRVDVAWLPPIVFTRIEDSVRPLGSILRGGKSLYEASLIVLGDSKIKNIDQLAGTRAGWVDSWSASGFIWQRVKLALMGVDPRHLFRSEMFHGSHRAVVKALRDGACDVAGTWSRSDEIENDVGAVTGSLVTGPWDEIEEPLTVRVLARFAGIPSDVIAIRKDASPDLEKIVLSLLQDACAGEATKPLMHAVFGGEQLQEGSPPGYEALKTALDLASLRGLFD